MKSRMDKDTIEFISTFPLATSLRSKKILVTGASGLIGGSLVRCLSSLNEEQNLDLKLFCPRHQELQDWLNNSPQEVDYIIHLACPTSSTDMVSRPVEVINAILQPTQWLLEYSRLHNVTMVYVSSMEVYGQVYTEEELSESFQGYIDPLSIRSSYSMGKRMAETLCSCYANEYGVDVKIARLVQTFGAGIANTDNRVFAQFARNVIAGKDIVLKTSGSSSRKYLYLTDAVSALLFILLKGAKGNAYNAARPDSYISILDMARMLQEDFNPSIKVIVDIDPNAPYPPDTHLNLSTAKLESLGWSALVPLKEMYVRLIDSLTNT